MKRLRIYADTSVIGGCLDAEFEVESRRLLELARQGTLTLLVSDLLLEELALAPESVQAHLAAVPTASLEPLMRTPESARLRDAYVDAGVLPATSSNDAHHVALATVARADLLVSWNFKHLVHFDKMRGFNAVNLREGYGPIEIHSPKEVV